MTSLINRIYGQHWLIAPLKHDWLFCWNSSRFKVNFDSGNNEFSIHSWKKLLFSLCTMDLSWNMILIMVFSIVRSSTVNYCSKYLCKFQGGLNIGCNNTGVSSLHLKFNWIINCFLCFRVSIAHVHLIRNLLTLLKITLTLLFICIIGIEVTWHWANKEDSRRQNECQRWNGTQSWQIWQRCTLSSVQ